MPLHSLEGKLSHGRDRAALPPDKDPPTIRDSGGKPGGTAPSHGPTPSRLKQTEKEGTMGGVFSLPAAEKRQRAVSANICACALHEGAGLRMPIVINLV